MLRNYSGVSSLLFTALFLVNLPASATGYLSCDAGPRDTWGTKQALRAKLSELGWVVRKIKVDAGCYEVYGTTPAKQRVEAYFDPVEFQKLLVVQRGKVLFRRPVKE